MEMHEEIATELRSPEDESLSSKNETKLSFRDRLMQKSNLAKTYLQTFSVSELKQKKLKDKITNLIRPSYLILRPSQLIIKMRKQWSKLISVSWRQRYNVSERNNKLREIKLSKIRSERRLTIKLIR
jgi:hypothetical protein